MLSDGLRCQQLLFGQGNRVQEGLHGRSPITPPALVHARFIVFREPPLQIALEVRKIRINLLPKGNPIELV
jgi:hypothetical protein